MRKMKALTVKMETVAMIGKVIESGMCCILSV